MTKYEIHIMPDAVDDWTKPPTTKPVFIMNKSPEIGIPMQYKGKFYSTRLIHSVGPFKYAYVKEFSFVDVDSDHTSEPVCPYCGEEVLDAWELSNEEEDHDCSTCGSIFDIHREVIYEYSTEKVKKSDPVEVEK